MNEPAARLRMLFDRADMLVMPCCFDALSARLIEQAGFPLTLLSAAVFAIREALAELAAGRTPKRRVDFRTLRDLVGFDAYDDLLKRY